MFTHEKYIESDERLQEADGVCGSEPGVGQETVHYLAKLRCEEPLRKTG